FEVVREVEGSQPKPAKQNGFQKRINKLNERNDKANERADKVASDLELEREQNKILKIALEQSRNKPEPITKPNPEDFDGGQYDPEFEKKQAEFNEHRIKSEVAQQLEASRQQAEVASNGNAQTRELEKKQIAHYEKADSIGAKDYAETEDKAIEILGNQVVNQVISNFDDSHVLLYFLGKNPAEAQRLQSLIESNPIKGVAEMGRLQSELKIKPKNRTTPEPDEELEGGSSSASSGAALKGATFT
ncbi:MAG: hypothetical protein HOM01_15060, partial [Kordiimonadaceae bacterium]|nr:hypothetical protein [Kordiimonadaceae bacterium]